MTKKNAVKAGGAVPALFGIDAAKVLAMQSLHLVRHSLAGLDNTLQNAACNGLPWNDEEVELDSISELAQEEVDRLLLAGADNLDALEARWWRLAAVLNQAVRSYPHKDTTHFRFLRGAADEFNSLPNVWNFVAEKGSYGAPTTHQQEGGAA
ncbi:hypothetical protein SAMN05428957_103277 [Oryzisolibacter propanilivorax]|uniref:Uncharacterized protein n=1 Tax=Oryzisolibacter propanilivorax TaxID=1527607 RepID=A0A1G9RHA3_9BURK|nr:hypothetical protein [Oryzisolibacter propanilivorax]SDM22618.1 hypothetical protein SAMN05428957_103277 [Oryzisolibacter propanilivorax]